MLVKEAPVSVIYVIQIKICAEYRDMLPRPRLDLLGTPDKPAFTLNLFYSIHFPFFLFLCGFGWEICRTAIMHSAHCSQIETGHQPIKAPSMPCWGAASPWKHSLAFMPGLVKLTDKMDKIYISGKLSVQEPSEWRCFCIPVSNFTVFQPRI